MIKRICVGMVFLPRTDYSEQEKCREIIESVLLDDNYYIYGWRQVPINPSVLGKTADESRPEIAQVIFKKMRICQQMTLKEISLNLGKKLKN